MFGLLVVKELLHPSRVVPWYVVVDNDGDDGAFWYGQLFFVQGLEAVADLVGNGMQS